MSTNPRPVTPRTELPRHVDVLIVGAGISGIGLACHLRAGAPGKTFAVVDARENIGGTWDLFKYPGIRSDSDLQTFGYAFKPWTKRNAIADAHEILDYLKEAIAEHGLARDLHLGLKVVTADWSSETARWTVVLHDTTGDFQEVTCGVLFSAAGYYDYAAGHTPHFEGREDFAGKVVHPQEWPEDLDYAGKRVVVIGSGATAVTLIPAMAAETEHITMLQRSPSYVLPIPRQDPIANTLRRLLPEKLAYALTRRINIARFKWVYKLSQEHPGAVRWAIRTINKTQLPAGYEIDTHFNPTYNPWDQRLCMVPDGDLFKAISDGSASVVTDGIERFTERGIKLTSGRELEADIIVTATGLNLLAFGGMQLRVDGDLVDVGDRLAYKSMMLSGVPNFAFAIGYTNASWTLKVDLVCEHLCRMLAHMDRQGHTTVVPVEDASVERRPLLDFAAGYVKRSLHQFPQQGTSGPWKVEMRYAADRERLRHGPVADPALRFSTAASAPVRVEVVA